MHTIRAVPTLLQTAGIKTVRPCPRPRHSVRASLDKLCARHCTGTRTRWGRAHKDALTPKRPPEHTGRHRIGSIQRPLASVTDALLLSPLPTIAMLCLIFW